MPVATILLVILKNVFFCVRTHTVNKYSSTRTLAYLSLSVRRKVPELQGPSPLAIKLPFSRSRVLLSSGSSLDNEETRPRVVEAKAWRTCGAIYGLHVVSVIYIDSARRFAERRCRARLYGEETCLRWRPERRPGDEALSLEGEKFNLIADCLKYILGVKFQRDVNSNKLRKDFFNKNHW